MLILVNIYELCLFQMLNILKIVYGIWFWICLIQVISIFNPAYIPIFFCKYKIMMYYSNGIDCFGLTCVLFLGHLLVWSVCFKQAILLAFIITFLFHSVFSSLFYNTQLAEKSLQQKILWWQFIVMVTDILF